MNWQVTDLAVVSGTIEGEPEEAILMSQADIQALRQAVRELQSACEKMAERDLEQAKTLARIEATWQAHHKEQRERVSLFWSKDWTQMQSEVSNLWAAVGRLDRESAGIRERLALPASIFAAAVAIATAAAQIWG